MKLTITLDGEESTIELTEDTAWMCKQVLEELNDQEDADVSAAEFVKEPAVGKIMEQYQQVVMNREGVQLGGGGPPQR